MLMEKAPRLTVPKPKSKQANKNLGNKMVLSLGPLTSSKTLKLWTILTWYQSLNILLIGLPPLSFVQDQCSLTCSDSSPALRTCILFSSVFSKGNFHSSNLETDNLG